jgi:PKD repeat protein
MEVATMRRVALLALGLFAAPIFAQTWTRPAKTPNTDVTCTTCPGKAQGKQTVGYPAALGAYVGRYLDSDNVNDFQQNFRTARARHVIPALSRGRIYFIIGSAVFAYDADRFFQRLAASEQLADIAIVPVTWNFPLDRGGGPHEIVLSYDEFFYAENSGAPWIINASDGQERLKGVDFDDQGYVYLAHTLYGWGIVRDEGKRDGDLMGTLFQDLGQQQGSVQPLGIAVLKGSAGNYYAFISNTASTPINVWDVTNRQQPTRVSTPQKSMVRYAKTADNMRIGLTTVEGKFEVYTADSLANGGAALISVRGPGDSDVRGVATDGTNFFIASDASSGLAISVYAPDGGGYRKLGDYPTNRYTLSTMNLHYDGGYLVQSGLTGGTYELRLFKVSNFQVSEVDLGGYFQHYYVINPDAKYATPRFGIFYDSTVVKRNGHTYLIATGYGLGDVYELPGSGSIAITNQGSVGHANPNRPPGGAAGPFYGDPVGFNASITGAAPTNIQWDFGNPEAASVAADPNVVNGVTGTPISHRYSGLTSAAQLPLNRIVKATSIADANVSGAINVSIATPAVAVGIAGRSGTVTQASQLSAIPIVAGDRFVDASDGSVESHFDDWSIDGNVTKALPGDSVAVGACAASHTLNFDAHYGPYTGTPLVSLSDLPIGIHSAAYSVRPFGASIATAPSTADITFTATVRTTGDTTILSAAQVAALQYRWQLIDASSNVLVAGPSGSGAVPAFVVAKSSFTSRGIHARLTLTSPTPAGGACAGLNMETVDAFTQALNGPDPAVDGGCAADGGPPCSFRTLSASGVDQAADGWTYAWSVQPATFRGSTNAATFAPAFTAVGQYTVKVTVTNAIGTSTATKDVTVTKTPPVCPPMSPGNNVFIAYQSASGSCSFVGGACNANEPITFAASAFNYDFACDTHTFTWDFGDGAGGSAKTLNHSYGAAGIYTVTLTIRNASESASMSVAVTVGQPPPPCQIMVPGTNVFAAFSAASGCTSANTKPCRVAETINFGAGASGYDYNCATHSFQWDFGDGKTATTSSINVQHSYAAVGTYNVALTISNGTQSVSTTGSVRVAATKDCPALSASSFFIAYNGPKSQCTYVGDTTCSNAEDVGFNAAAALGFDASCGTLTYQWDFGDGSAALSGASVTHKFAAAGKYDVKVAVSDGTTSVTYVATVKVRDDNFVLECAFDFTVEPRVVGGTVLPNEFVFIAAGANGATAASYEWDFGDGTRTTGSAPQQTHAYADGQIYTVTLTVPGTNCRVQHTTVKPRRRAAGR